MKTNIRESNVGDFVVFTKGHNFGKMFSITHKESESVILTDPDGSDVLSKLDAWNSYNDYIICETEQEYLLAKLKYV